MTAEDVIVNLVISRKMQGISQADIAVALDIPQPTVSRMESFRQPMTVEQACAYSNVVGLGLTLRPLIPPPDDGDI